MKILKNQSGAVSLYVIMSLLALTVILIGIFTSMANSEASQVEATRKIREIYETRVTSVDEIYYSLNDNSVVTQETHITNGIRIEGTGISKGLEITIPPEFTPCTVDDNGNATKISNISTWKTYISPNIKNGIVVMDTEDNEYVWVPVNGQIGGSNSNLGGINNGKVNFTRQNFGKQEGEATYYQAETISEAERLSVEKYKGFYVARYEAGDGVTSVARTSGAGVNNPVVSQKDVHTYNFVTKQQAQTLSENYAGSKGYTNLISTLTSSYAWDAILNFCELNQRNVLDSREWGNHSDSTGDAISGKGSIKKTGYNRAWVAANIYDIAGNLLEWTMEISTASATNTVVSRGGYYDFDGVNYPASYRGYSDQSSSGGNITGFRPTLYISIQLEPVTLGSSSVNTVSDVVRILGTGDSIGMEITIPKELTPCTVDSSGKVTKMRYTADWQTYISPNIKNGIVVMDKDLNEYVWIPVNGDTEGTNDTSGGLANGKINFTRQNFERQNGNFVDYSQSINSVEKESISKYKGFYISRYEMGDESATEQRGINAGITSKAVSQKGKYTYNNVTFLEAQTLVEGYSASKGYSNVTSRLTSGYAWDAIMNFASINGKDIFNSTSWGNYQDSANGGSIQQAGYSQTWSVANIYDIAGNIGEWTTEKYNTTNAVIRGGDFSVSGTASPVAYRTNTEDSTSNSNTGFRVALYITKGISQI